MLPTSLQRAFIIINPVAGNSHADQVRDSITRRFEANNIAYDICETTGEENLAEIVQQALPCDMVVVAGGDGTISQAVDGLHNADTTLGIVPVGTANILAKDLGIPLEVEAACDLLVSATHAKPIDVMQVGAHLILSHVSMGVYALEASNTPTESKRTWGVLAYASRVLDRVSRKEAMWPFEIKVDGETHHTEASLVLVANTGPVGLGQLRWAADIQPDDGQLDVVIFTTDSLIAYLRILEQATRTKSDDHPDVTHLTARERVEIRCEEALPVQADGEIVTEQAVQVSLLPQALRVLTP